VPPEGGGGRHIEYWDYHDNSNTIAQRGSYCLQPGDDPLSHSVAAFVAKRPIFSTADATACCKAQWKITQSFLETSFDDLEDGINTNDYDFE